MRRNLTESEKMEKIQEIADAYNNDTEEKRSGNDYMEDIIDVLIGDFLYDIDKGTIVHRYSKNA